MEKKKRTFHLLPQVMLIFVVSVVAVGLLSYFTQQIISERNIKQQMEVIGSEIAEGTKAAITEYPSYEWLFEYWYAHAEELDIEYDVEFTSGTATEEKLRVLTDRHPGLQLNYAGRQDAESMSPEDQKLFAEVAYSWMTTRINHIKRAYNIDFLFIVMTDDTFSTQYFLLSGANPGAVRGRDYLEVYPLGMIVRVSESQQEAMRNAKENNSHLADAGDYVDLYTWLWDIQGTPVYIGMTYNLSEIKAAATAQTLRETLYAMIFQIVLAAVCMMLMYYFVLSPLGKVQKNIRLFKTTKEGAAVAENLKQIQAHNEIGELADDVSELAQEMDDYVRRIETITAEKERISTEMSLAAKIQASMLPHNYPLFPGRTEFDVFASMDPAKEVGGDFYDVFLVDEDHLGIVIADVSGKGVPAALFMMASKIILQSVAMLGGSPSEILTRTNQAICSNNQAEMFITAWVGILELSTGRLIAANAGHEYPMMKTPGGKFEMLKEKHGFVLGGLETAKYREYEMSLEPGAKLFLYTDGVPEATDPENNMFGTERTLDALNEASEEGSEEILKNVRKAVDAFVREAEQFDDLTMLCLEYKGKTAGPEGRAEE